MTVLLDRMRIVELVTEDAEPLAETMSDWLRHELEVITLMS